jgi:hypothetical protein
MVRVALPAPATAEQSTNNKPAAKDDRPHTSWPVMSTFDLLATHSVVLLWLGTTFTAIFLRSPRASDKRSTFPVEACLPKSDAMTLTRPSPSSASYSPPNETRHGSAMLNEYGCAAASSGVIPDRSQSPTRSSIRRLIVVSLPLHPAVDAVPPPRPSPSST